ncbi:MAG: GntR family transcriptional regulator [Lachnospiraceae bacterium]
MTWQLDSNKPVYSQIIDRVKMDIINGVYQPGDKLPSVRDLASMAAVNPNTMQKALSELERTNLIYTERTSGRYITTDTELIQNIRKQLAESYIHDFFQRMDDLGYRRQELMELIQKIIKEES